MLLLLLAFLFLAVVAWRLLAPQSSRNAESAHLPDAVAQDSTKPSSRIQRLLDEAFEFSDLQPNAAATDASFSSPIASESSPLVAEDLQDDSADEVQCAVTGGHPASAPASRLNILVLYATEYGFAKEVARRAASILAKRPLLRPRVVNVAHYECIDFSRESVVLLVCSTTGDGVPPNESRDFCDALRHETVHLPPTVRFAVLALGDRGYPHFCRGGAVFDGLFAKSTGTPALVPRAEIDQEDWGAIFQWVRSLRRKVHPLAQGGAAGALLPHHGICSVDAAVAGLVSRKDPTTHGPTAKGCTAKSNADSGLETAVEDTDYLRAAIEKHAKAMENSSGNARVTRNNPYAARVVLRKQLTVPTEGMVSRNKDEDKRVVRVEFDLSDSGITYQAGDALGVVPQNNPEKVEAVLMLLAATGDEPVVTGVDGPACASIHDTTRAAPVPFKDALLGALDIRAVRPELIDALGVATDVAGERELAASLLGQQPGSAGVHHNPSQLSPAGRAYVQCRDVQDVLGDFVGARLTPAEVARLLRPLTARYYSISTAPAVHVGRVGITVDVLRYSTSVPQYRAGVLAGSAMEMRREGVASTYLDRQVVVGESRVGLFVSRNDNFRLPTDTARPIIMVGPGTGIAPFMAFLEERVASDAVGRNMLFFGCRHAEQDFLYRDRLKELVASGDVELEIAFSRDQAEKIYVQDRLRQRAGDVWRMVNEENGHVYVCGDGTRMARDVQAALHGIVQERGGMGRAEALEYVERLREAGRMQLDVWVP